MPRNPTSVAVCLAIAGWAAAALAGCAGRPSAVSDPITTLATPDSSDKQIATALAALGHDPGTPEYIPTLRRMLHAPGYTIAARTMALDTLAEIDPEAMQRTLEVQLPRMDTLEWRRRLCEIIAQRGWTQYGPTLVRAWADPRPGWVDKDEDRPERKALEKLFGRDKLADYLFQTLVESSGVAQQNLRTRCWELLLRLGERGRLVELMESTTVGENDLFLADLRASVAELQVFPSNREEILWLRKLRQPARRAFWEEARIAVERLPEDRRHALEIRDLSVVVAAARHQPDLLAASEQELYGRLEAYLRTPQAGQAHRISFEGWGGEHRQTLYEWRGRLTWGDLAAMLLAVEALQTPQVVDHLFDYADRDLRDTSTEYGGVLRLDEQGRYELLEFPPRIRGNDERFDAPQELLDAGYTGLFHFHFHATKYNNAKYAAPAQGDAMYANNTRANALVFTFIDRGTLNVDFYRHDDVSVDLGVVRRTASRSG